MEKKTGEIESGDKVWIVLGRSKKFMDKCIEGYCEKIIKDSGLAKYLIKYEVEKDGIVHQTSGWFHFGKLAHNHQDWIQKNGR